MDVVEVLRMGVMEWCILMIGLHPLLFCKINNKENLVVFSQLLSFYCETKWEEKNHFFVN
jgi:hypothetical protein